MNGTDGPPKTRLSLLLRKVADYAKKGYAATQKKLGDSVASQSAFTTIVVIDPRDPVAQVKDLLNFAKYGSAMAFLRKHPAERETIIESLLEQQAVSWLSWLTTQFPDNNTPLEFLGFFRISDRLIILAGLLRDAPELARPLFEKITAKQEKDLRTWRDRAEVSGWNVEQVAVYLHLFPNSQINDQLHMAYLVVKAGLNSFHEHRIVNDFSGAGKKFPDLATLICGIRTKQRENASNEGKVS
ncbi:hypothetical protein COT42_01535 [Candidatus Saganbacteria bacterium CG08_land_8_20_14_0_20_45_16]|uniref:Uncharacterized protein n=1 Tax=Candidatus Saganbacteria bacterium CG08_land_8_20_14_0_20_45_16 TaxID=2014293 RepID=A0A2H0Y163_UNCSA|nr:MAG: hypothetical protein COT42_01535 [Candidatus Saganbacteria bacterium CG08_land_8_20_14_0_20_45_16]